MIAKPHEQQSLGFRFCKTRSLHVGKDLVGVRPTDEILRRGAFQHLGAICDYSSRSRMKR